MPEPKQINKNIDSQILRARWHDYRDEGYYMITMVTNERAAAFGQLVGDSEESAVVVLNELGKVLKAEIETQHSRHPEIDIEEYVIMEDHCHMFVHVNRGMDDHLGKVVWGIKYGTTAAYLNALNTREGKIHRIEGTRLSQRERHDGGNTTDKHGSHNRLRNNVRCGASTSDINLVPPLWQQGYHDRIVTRYGQIATLRRYIRRNPARLWLKRHADRQLARVRNLCLPLTMALAQRLKDTAIYWDQRRDVQHSQFSHRHDGSHYSESYVELVQKFLRKSITGGVTEPFLQIKYCGNRGLIESGRPLVRVRISRSVTQWQFQDEVQRILDLCEREGAIAVSPFRSWSEKALLSLLRINGYDHIIIHGEAMWDGWKPQDGSTASHRQQVPDWFTNITLSLGGRVTGRRALLGDVGGLSGDITEVYAGRCAFMALWPDRPRGERATKADCEVMNEVAMIMEMMGGE